MKDLVMVPLNRLVPSRWQPRQAFDEAKLLELARDIELRGLLNPLLVWVNEDGEYELIAGERRTRALWACYLVRVGAYGSLDEAVGVLAKQSWRSLVGAGAIMPGDGDGVAALVVEGAEATLHEMAIVDNLQRADLNEMEEAQALHDLMETAGYSQRQLAERLSVSQTWISQRLALLRLADDVGAEVAAGTLDAAMGRAVARLEGEVQGAFLKHVRTLGWNSKVAAEAVGEVLKVADPEEWAADNAVGQMMQYVLGERSPAERQMIALKYGAGRYDGRAMWNGGEHTVNQLLRNAGLANMQEGWRRYAMANGRTRNYEDRVTLYDPETDRVEVFVKADE